ncbi:MAG TPA: DUF2909 domain-containing protein [Oceanospirillaceae bacterium]|nr:DUF2909 domain-containing protein [Oceanospirillaceae bacterium]
MLKLIIAGLFFAALSSLFAGLYFLLKDQQDSTRLLTSLKFRIVISLLLIVVIVYGFLSGNLSNQSPWGSIHS